MHYIKKDGENPHFLSLRDWFGQLRSPGDEHVFNRTGLSGQETLGQNYALDSCFQPLTQTVSPAQSMQVSCK